jgi:hypothetical protein
MYFYVHRTLGHVLAPFLGAGLTGLTQKSQFRDSCPSKKIVRLGTPAIVAVGHRLHQ